MSKSIDVKLLFALAGVAVFWGTTYLGIRIAVETIPPWYVTTLRQLTASSILLVLLLSKKEFKWIGWQNLKVQAILSILMVVLANGLTTVAETSIPSGLTSLLNALSPLFVFLGAAIMGMEKFTVKGVLGLLLGFLGVAFIFRGGFQDLFDPGYRMGILCLFIAISSWACGTIYSKRTSLKSNNIFLNLFYQFFISTIIQFGLALIFSGKPVIANWSYLSIGAALYLAIFGSILGFLCYHYALKKVSASDVSILTYFNTIIALFLGWFVLNEHISKDIIVATVLIISGVFITNYKNKKA